MKLKNRISIIVSLLLVPAIFTGCTHKSKDEKANTIVIGLQADLKTLDPANAYDSVSLDVMPSIYESLYQYSYLTETVQVEPLLAADMPQYSKDRLTLTIPIKHGIKYADDPCFKATNGKGRDVVAQDFIYGFKRLALPELQSQGWWIFDGKIAGINAFRDKLTAAKGKEELEKAFNEPIEGLKAIDDYTLQIKLLKPYPQLKYILTMGFTVALPKEAIDAYGDEKGNLLDKPVGSGPYVLREWARHQHVILDRNPNYHPDFYPTKASPEYAKRGMLNDAGKQLPFADRIIFAISEEQQPMWLNFLKGNQDAVLIPKDNFKQAIANRNELTPEFSSKGIGLTIESGSTFYYVSFNMKDKLIGGNKYLRQAMAASVNREEWIDIFTNGTGLKMVSALPPGLPDRNNNKKMKFDFDLTQAKELLSKAGYPDGKGLPTIKFDLRGAGTLDRQMGDFFKKQFQAINVPIDVILNTFPAYLEKMKQGNLQVSLGGWNLDYPDAENVYQLLYGPNSAPGPNEANFNVPEMNKLYEQTAIMESSAKRAALFQRMDDILQDSAPWAMGYYATFYYLSQPWLKNFRGPDIIQNRHKYLRLDQEIKKKYQSTR